MNLFADNHFSLIINISKKQITVRVRNLDNEPSPKLYRRNPDPSTDLGSPARGLNNCDLFP